MPVPSTVPLGLLAVDDTEDTTGRLLNDAAGLEAEEDRDAVPTALE